MLSFSVMFGMFLGVAINVGNYSHTPLFFLFFQASTENIRFQAASMKFEPPRNGIQVCKHQTWGYRQNMILCMAVLFIFESFDIEKQLFNHIN